MSPLPRKFAVPGTTVGLIAARDLLYDAVAYMEHHGYDMLLVLEHKRPVGLVSYEQLKMQLRKLGNVSAYLPLRDVLRCDTKVEF